MEFGIFQKKVLFWRAKVGIWFRSNQKYFIHDMIQSAHVNSRVYKIFTKFLHTSNNYHPSIHFP